MQHQLILQLDEAVAEVFALMLNRECRPGQCSIAVSPGIAPIPNHPPSFRHDSAFKAASGLSALISFSGSLRGACSIHLALRTAALLTGELLGEPSEPSSPLTADTTGELCNMIAGSWKSRQPCNTAACALSSPLVSVEDHACTPTRAQAFRNTLIRTYKFQDHCLRMQLAFD